MTHTGGPLEPRQHVCQNRSRAEYAAHHGYAAIVLLLLRAGADTKLRSVNGKSALQLAKEQGHAACVEAFRQHIAEVTASQREAAAGGAGGASSGEAAAGAVAVSGSLGSLPEEARQAAARGDEAAHKPAEAATGEETEAAPLAVDGHSDDCAAKSNGADTATCLQL